MPRRAAFAFLIYLRDCSRILNVVVPIVRYGKRRSAVFVYLQRECVVYFGIEDCAERYNPSVVGLHGLVVLKILRAGVE